MNILPRILPRSQEQRILEYERELIRYEAKIGGQLFGEVPKNHIRQFFCLDQHTWVWHEEWKAKDGTSHSSTTKYFVRPTGIIKSQNGDSYKKLSNKETHNLLKAATLYTKHIDKAYTQVLQTTAI
jgi:hypothetical protein